MQHASGQNTCACAFIEELAPPTCKFRVPMIKRGTHQAAEDADKARRCDTRQQTRKGIQLYMIPCRPGSALAPLKACAAPAASHFLSTAAPDIQVSGRHYCLWKHCTHAQLLPSVRHVIVLVWCSVSSTQRLPRQPRNKQMLANPTTQLHAAMKYSKQPKSEAHLQSRDQQEPRHHWPGAAAAAP
jgi:hypothetical protein